MEEKYPIWLYLSTLFSISPPKMETETCRFGTISDSAMRSTSCWCFFRNSFLLSIIANLLDLQAAHTDAPWKNCWQLPSDEILSADFLVYPTLTSLTNWTTIKTASRNKISIKFYVWKWAVDNVITKTMVTPCQKNLRNMFLRSLQININKARQARFSTAGYVWTTWAKQNFLPAVWSAYS